MAEGIHQFARGLRPRSLVLSSNLDEISTKFLPDTAASKNCSVVYRASSIKGVVGHK
jgi:hypothetical protein